MILYYYMRWFDIAMKIIQALFKKAKKNTLYPKAISIYFSEDILLIKTYKKVYLDRQISTYLYLYLEIYILKYLHYVYR